MNIADIQKINENYRNFELKKDSEIKDNIFDELIQNKYGEVMRSYRNLLDKIKKTIIDNKILKSIEKNFIEFVNHSDTFKTFDYWQVPMKLESLNVDNFINIRNNFYI